MYGLHAFIVLHLGFSVIDDGLGVVFSDNTTCRPLNRKRCRPGFEDVLIGHSLETGKEVPNVSRNSKSKSGENQFYLYLLVAIKLKIGPAYFPSGSAFLPNSTGQQTLLS